MVAAARPSEMMFDDDPFAGTSRPVRRSDDTPAQLGACLRIAVGAASAISTSGSIGRGNPEHVLCAAKCRMLLVDTSMKRDVQ